MSNFIQRAGRAARGRDRTGLAVLLVEKSAYNVDLVSEPAPVVPEATKEDVREYAQAHGASRGGSDKDDTAPSGCQPRLDPDSADEGLLAFVQSVQCRRKVWAKAFESINCRSVEPLPGRCCDLCCPSLLEATRPAPLPAGTRATQLKQGLPDFAARDQLRQWRERVFARDHSWAQYDDSAILTDELVTALSSSGPLTGEQVRAITRDKWVFGGRYCEELEAFVQTLNIVFTALPKKVRTNTTGAAGAAAVPLTAQSSTPLPPPVLVHDSLPTLNARGQKRPQEHPPVPNSTAVDAPTPVMLKRPRIEDCTHPVSYTLAHNLPAMPSVLPEPTHDDSPYSMLPVAGHHGTSSQYTVVPPRYPAHGQHVHFHHPASAERPAASAYPEPPVIPPTLYPYPAPRPHYATQRTVHQHGVPTLHQNAHASNSASQHPPLPRAASSYPQPELQVTHPLERHYVSAPVCEHRPSPSPLQTRPESSLAHLAADRHNTGYHHQAMEPARSSATWVSPPSSFPAQAFPTSTFMPSTQYASHGHYAASSSHCYYPLEQAQTGPSGMNHHPAMTMASTSQSPARTTPSRTSYYPSHAGAISGHHSSNPAITAEQHPSHTMHNSPWEYPDMSASSSFSTPAHAGVGHSEDSFNSLPYSEFWPYAGYSTSQQ